MKDPDKLALLGGAPARPRPAPPMFPGAMAMDEEEEQAVLAVVRNKRLFRYYGPNPGPSKTLEFEQAFAAYLGAPYARAVSSGTAALVCSLVGAGIGPGDEVIVPAYTWIATAAAVVAVGAVPVVAEVDESLTLDPEDLRDRLTPLTKAVIPVHMRGGPADMDAVLGFAQERGLLVVEDVAQACGGSYRGRMLGTLGDFGAFSFQVNKIMTTGEGGMFVSANQQRWQRASLHHDLIGEGMGRQAMAADGPLLPGQNHRASEFVGALGLVQLRKLPGLLARMRDRKRYLRAALAEIPGLRLRRILDADGDCATSIVMILPEASAGKALEFSLALTAENVPAQVLYHPRVRDAHVYVHWKSIVAKSSTTEAGSPWNPRIYSGSASYSPETCPKTLRLLGRAVAIDVNPLVDDEELEQIVAAVAKVAKFMLR